jgi:hypothetical protein
MERESGVTDFFSRQPHRVREALERGDLDFYEYGVVSFLVAKLDRDRGELPLTLRALADVIQWPRELSHEYLRQKLHRLDADGWVRCISPGVGGKGPWLFKLGSAAVRPPTSLQLETPSQLEVTSNTTGGEEPARPHEQLDSAGSPAPTASQAPSTSYLRRGADELGREDQGEEVTFEKDSLDPEVREAVERAQRARRAPTLPQFGDASFSGFSRQRHRDGHLAHAEHCDNLRAHRLVRNASPPPGEHEFVRVLMEQFPGSELRETSP